MAGVNALFAPFIVLYLLMYSFFRYFEVRPSHSASSSAILSDTSYSASPAVLGVPQEPFLNRWTDVHALRQVEVPRVQ